MRIRFNEKKDEKVSALNNREVLIMVVTFLALLLLLLLSIGEAKAQSSIKGKIGVSISSTATGSGHGTNYSPQIHYNFKNSSISVGPNIQKRLSNISGVQVNYQRTICSRANTLEEEEDINYDSLFTSDEFEEDFYDSQPYNKRVEAYILCTTIYHHSANLSQSSIAEQRGFNGTDIDLANLKYRTLESYAGFGLRIRLTDHLKWNNAVAYGGYISSEGPCMLRMQRDVALMVRTSLNYTF